MYSPNVSYFPCNQKKSTSACEVDGEAILFMYYNRGKFTFRKFQ